MKKNTQTVAEQLAKKYHKTEEVKTLKEMLYRSAQIYKTRTAFRKKDKNNKSLYNSICIMSLLLIILMCYDSTLRSNVCYFTYICLTLPFLLNKKSLN